MSEQVHIRTQEPFQYTSINQQTNIANKRRIMDLMTALLTAPAAELSDVLQDAYTPNANVNVTHPVNTLYGTLAAGEQFWLPLRHAIPDAERRDMFVAGGRYRDGDWVACMGHILGTFESDWVSIPATHGVVSVRYGEAHRLQDGKIAESYLFIDFLDLMRQVGYWPLAPSLGREMQWLPPATGDGLVLAPQDETISRRTIDAVLRMHGGLFHYDGNPPTREVLDKMGMVDHWHPNFMWYGPAGIGTTRGLRGFEDYHQIPFLVAFPDRGGNEIGHFIRIGDGHFAVTGGWGYLQATHLGNDFLGVPPTGKLIQMRVMDFYRCDDETICENWIPIDVPHILLQMGVDVFGRMRHQFRQHGRIRSREWLVGS